MRFGVQDVKSRVAGKARVELTSTGARYSFPTTFLWKAEPHWVVGWGFARTSRGELSGQGVAHPTAALALDKPLSPSGVQSLSYRRCHGLQKSLPLKSVNVSFIITNGRG